MVMGWWSAPSSSLPPDFPGLEFTVESKPLHFTVKTLNVYDPLEFTVRTKPMHFTVAPEGGL